MGPLQPIGPRLAHRHSVNKIPFAASEALTLRRLPLLFFDFAICALVFAAGALVFASLRLSLPSPLAPRSSPYASWSSPLFACLRLRLWRLGLHRMRLGLRRSSLLFVFACGASVFARSLKPFDCSACRAGRRPCHCIQIARGPSVDGRRWRPQHSLLLVVLHIRARLWLHQTAIILLLHRPFQLLPLTYGLVLWCRR